MHKGKLTNINPPRITTEPQSHVLRLAHPPIPTVHIGIIGLGNRGLLTLQRYLQIEGVEIKVLFVK